MCKPPPGNRLLMMPPLLLAGAGWPGAGSGVVIWALGGGALREG